MGLGAPWGSDSRRKNLGETGEASWPRRPPPPGPGEAGDPSVSVQVSEQVTHHSQAWGCFRVTAGRAHSAAPLPLQDSQTLTVKLVAEVSPVPRDWP